MSLFTRRRWLRVVTPLAVVALFWLASALVHWYEEPNLSNAGTLSPTGTGRHGSSQLAERLRSQGIQIERVTSSAAAGTAARGVDATIFVPTPDYLVPGFLEGWVDGSAQHRVVLVKPGLLTTFTLGLPAVVDDSRWATRVASPGCSTGFAASAGVAAVRHDRYAADRPDIHCYEGSLIGFRDASTEIVYIGATDPFRNNRIAENGNAALATGLLGAHQKLIWVDVHAAEPRPRPDIDFSLPDYERGDRNRTSTGNPLLDAFPAGLWAVLLVLAAGALLLGVARARRLGPPVPEPLPVLVPAAEAVTGRGRLYRRIGARQASLDALRLAAIARLARVLDPLAGAAPERELAQPGPAADRFVAQLAARAGWSVNGVHDVLYGRSPDDDKDLVRAVAQLDELVRAVTYPPSTPGGAP
jgi:uncharacterized protein DUF4350